MVGWGFEWVAEHTVKPSKLNNGKKKISNLRSSTSIVIQRQDTFSLTQYTLLCQTTSFLKNKEVLEIF